MTNIPIIQAPKHTCTSLINFLLLVRVVYLWTSIVTIELINMRVQVKRTSINYNVADTPINTTTTQR